MPDFHTRLRPDDIPSEGLEFVLTADAQILQQLRQRFGLGALSRLTARLNIWREAGGIRLKGDFSAEVRRQCVVTLQDFESCLSEPIDLLFVPEPVDSDKEEILIDPDAEEDIEPLPEEGVDIGEVVAQSLSLALDPFPRAPDAGHIDPGKLAPYEDRTEASPFAVLKKLRDKA